MTSLPRSRLTACLTALLLLSGCRACRRAGMPLDAALDDAVAAHVKPAEPGFAVLVARGGTPIFRRAYGLARLQPQEPLAPEHAFQIGSITKQFTACAVMLLEAEGKLSLGDDLARWAPGFPTGGRRVTLEQLLASTSGLPDFTLRPDWTAHLGQHDSPEAFLARFAAPPEWEPGSQWFYSNTGYYLLGTVIEAASGRSYAEFLRQRFFDPLGMRHTRTMSEQPLAGERLAAGYEQDQSKLEPAPFVDDSQVGAAGDLISTVDDLLLWDEALRRGQVLAPAALARARTPVVVPGKPPPYEFTHGWVRFQVDGQTCFGTKGGIDSGYTTWLSDCPAPGLVISVLTNSTDPRIQPDRLGNELLHEVLSRSKPGNP